MPVAEPNPKKEQFGSPEDVTTLFAWANMRGAKYRDFSASRARAREEIRRRVEEATEEERIRQLELAQREAQEAAQRAALEAAAQAEAIRRAEAERLAEIARQAEAERQAVLAAQEAQRRAQAQRQHGGPSMPPPVTAVPPPITAVPPPSTFVEPPAIHDFPAVPRSSDLPVTMPTADWPAPEWMSPAVHPPATVVAESLREFSPAVDNGYTAGIHRPDIATPGLDPRMDETQFRAVPMPDAAAPRPAWSAAPVSMPGIPPSSAPAWDASTPLNPPAPVPAQLEPQVVEDWEKPLLPSWLEELPHARTVVQLEHRQQPPAPRAVPDAAPQRLQSVQAVAPVPPEPQFAPAIAQPVHPSQQASSWMAATAPAPTHAPAAAYSSWDRPAYAESTPDRSGYPVPHASAPDWSASLPDFPIAADPAATHPTGTHPAAHLPQHLPQQGTMRPAVGPAGMQPGFQPGMQPGYPPPAPFANTFNAPAEDPLLASRERITRNWFALKSVFHPEAVPQERPMPQVPERIPTLAVFSLAGGVGKTSLLAALARALSSRAERVLLVDLSAYGLMPFFFGARDQKPGQLRTFSPPTATADAAIHMVTLDPEKLKQEPSGPDALVREIQQHAHGANRILIDLPTASGAAMRRVLRLNPTVLVPLTPDMNSVVSVGAIESFFQNQMAQSNAQSQPLYILNHFDPSQQLHVDVRNLLREQIGNRLLPFVLRSSPAISEALAEGMTVMDYAPGTVIAEDYLNLANWIRSLSAPAAVAPRGVRWSEQ